MPTTELLINSNIQQIRQGLEECTKTTDKLTGSTKEYEQAENKAFDGQDPKKQAEAIGQVSTATDKMSGLFAKAAMLIGGAFSVTAVFAFGRASVAAYNDTVRAMAKVEAAVRATGGAAGFTAEQLKKIDDALEQNLAVDADEVMNKVTAQLLTFPEIVGKNFEDAQVAALDISTLLGGDMQSAAIMLGKALQDPIMGLNAMRRVGISFSEDQKDVIQNLVKSNNLYEAQSKILEIINSQYGGQAKALAETNVGKAQALALAWGNVQETVGEFISEGLTPLVTLMSDLITPAESAQEQFDKLSKSVKNNTDNVMPMVEEYENLKAITNPSNEQQARMNELIQLIAKNVPTAITALDEYGNVIGVSTEKARDFVSAQNALLAQKNADAIDEWESKIKKAKLSLDMLETKMTVGEMTDAGQWIRGNAEEMANWAAESKQLGEEIKLAENAIKLLKGEKVESPVDPNAPKKVEQVIESLDKLKEKMDVLKKEQSAAPLKPTVDLNTGQQMKTFGEYQPEIDALQKQIDLYEKKDEGVKKNKTTVEENLKSLEDWAEKENKITFDLELGFGGGMTLEEYEKKIADNLKGFEEQMNQTPEVSTGDSTEAKKYEDMLTMAQQAYSEKVDVQKQALQTQLADLDKFYQDQQALADTGGASVKMTAEEYAAAIEKIKKELKGLETFKDKHPIAAALGIEDEEQLRQIQEFYGQLNQFVNDMVQQQIDATSQIIDDLNRRIDEQQQIVDRELELKEQGLANMYEAEKENLKKMQDLRNEELKAREKELKIQRMLATVQAGIAMVVAIANIFKNDSDLGPWGWVIAIAGVAATVAAFIAATAKTNKATQMEEGGQVHGLLRGKRHRDGGIPIEAEDGEYFVNRKSSQKYLPLLEAINRDELMVDRLAINKTFNNVNKAQKDIDDSRKLGKIIELLEREDGTWVTEDYLIEKHGSYTKRTRLR